MRVDWERMLMGFRTQVNLPTYSLQERQLRYDLVPNYSVPDNMEDLGCCCVHPTNPLHD
jgi:hypothetical protein